MNFLRWVTQSRLAAGLLLLGLLRIQAQPVIYSATGTRDQIQPTIDRFKHDIVYGIGVDNAMTLSSYNVATLDGLEVGFHGISLNDGGLSLYTGPAISLFVNTTPAAYS